MKKILLLPIAVLFMQSARAAGGDSVFLNQVVHSLYITFPYPAFYDSFLNSHATDIYLDVDIVFDGTPVNNVGIKAKGNSSFNNPSQKKSFKLDFNEFVSGQKLDGLKKLNFNNGFKDPSFMREKLTNDFLIQHNIPAPRTAYCNVYMNNQLWGLYAIVEQVDEVFCNNWFGNKDGNLFKGDPHGDLRWKGSPTQALYEPDYELKNNEAINNWSDLISLIDVINNTPDNVLYSTLEAKLNTANFLRQWAALNLFSSLDSYIGSGHNYYIYHHENSGKFEWIAWDQNEMFGSFKMGLSDAQLKDMDIYYISNPVANRPLCNKMLLNSTYKSLYHDAYCELKTNFTNAYFDPKIDSLKNLIQQSVYNDPKKFYPNSKFDSSFNYDLTLQGPGGLKIFGLKKFISERSTLVDANLIANGVSCTPLSVNSIDVGSDFDFYPNPSGGYINIESGVPLSRIEILDLQGKLLQLVTPLPTTVYTLDISFLSTGIYILKTNGGLPRKLVRY